MAALASAVEQDLREIGYFVNATPAVLLAAVQAFRSHFMSGGKERVGRDDLVHAGARDRALLELQVLRHCERRGGAAEECQHHYGRQDAPHEGDESSRS